MMCDDNRENPVKMPVKCPKCGSKDTRLVRSEGFTGEVYCCMNPPCHAIFRR